jgi:hypothetical protein
MAGGKWQMEGHANYIQKTKLQIRLRNYSIAKNIFAAW